MSDKSARDAALSTMMFEANKKSVGVAYLLWFFLGGLGAHRFYAGKAFTAILLLLLFLLGWMTVIIGVGFVFLGIVGLWLLIDAFLIPGWIRNENMKLVQKITG